MASTVGRQIAGIGFSGRRIGYWIEHGAIAPSIHRGRGTGDPHRWSDADVARLRAIAAVDRDLRKFGAELRTAGVARLWEALEDRQATIRVGSVVVDFSALTVRALQDLAEAAS